MKIISTILKTKGSSELDKQVEIELSKEDPAKSVAHAIVYGQSGSTNNRSSDK